MSVVDPDVITYAMGRGARCETCPLANPDYTAGGALPRPDLAALGTSLGPYTSVGPYPIAFVADAPGQQEIDAGRAFVGPANTKLISLAGKVASVALTGSAFYTLAILCRPKIPGEQGKKAYDIKRWLAWLRLENMKRRKLNQPTLENPFACCAPRLRSELAWLETEAPGPNGVVVVPMGNFALSSVLGTPGKPAGIMKYRGSVLGPTQVGDQML